MTTTPALALPARIAGDYPHERGPQPTRALVVNDPDAGEVLVRWRIPDHPTGWRWQCTACQTRTQTADCPHTFAAALLLATELLGLHAVGTAPVGNNTTHQEHRS